MAALLVLPPWLILRIAVWVTRAFGAEGAGGLPARLVLEGVVHREDAMRPRLAGIRATVQRGITLLKGALAKFPSHVAAAKKPTMEWSTTLLNRPLRKFRSYGEAAIKATVAWNVALLHGRFANFPGRLEAVIKSTVQRSTNLLNRTLPKLLGHGEAAIKATAQWSAILRQRSSWATFMLQMRQWRAKPGAQEIQDR